MKFVAAINDSFVDLFGQNSVEQQKYVSTLKREMAAFEALINEKAVSQWLPILRPS